MSRNSLNDHKNLDPGLHSAEQRLKARGSVLLVDDVGPVISGFIICSAATITESDVAFLVNHARGIVCAALPEEIHVALSLKLMSEKPPVSGFEFTVSVEARHGVSTGISAADRAQTLRVLSSTKEPTVDLVQPGHIFPVVARKGGVLVRSDVPEAAVDLLKLSSITPCVAVFCQCLNSSGELSSSAELQSLASEQNLPLVYVSEVIRARLASEVIIERIADAKLPTAYAGMFRALAFRSVIDNAEHLVLVKGDVSLKSRESKAVLVRVQSEHRIGDLLGLKQLLTRSTIQKALKRIDEEGRGVFVYVRHPRKGLLAKQVSELENPVPTPMSAQLREFGVGAQILSNLGIEKLRLLTNSDRDIHGLGAFHLEVVERVSFSKKESVRQPGGAACP